MLSARAKPELNGTAHRHYGRSPVGQGLTSSGPVDLCDMDGTLSICAVAGI